MENGQSPLLRPALIGRRKSPGALILPAGALHQNQKNRTAITVLVQASTTPINLHNQKHNIYKTQNRWGASQQALGLRRKLDACYVQTNTLLWKSQMPSRPPLLASPQAPTGTTHLTTLRQTWNKTSILYTSININKWEYTICAIITKLKTTKTIAMQFDIKTNPRQRRHFVGANIGQATKVLEIFIRKFIVSTEISSRERTPFKSIRSYELGF